MTHLLLDLQRLDSSADDLRARRTGMPERALLQQSEDAIAALVVDRTAAADRRAALARDEREAASLVTDLESRAREVESTLYSGKVKVIRELEGLQAELKECKRRLGEREDAELVVLEAQERLESEIAAIDARSEQLGAETAQLRAVIAAAEAQIDAELAGLAAERSALIPPLASAVLTVYEKLRASPRLRGRVAVGVASGACNGCNSILPSMLVSRLHRATADEAVQCMQCQRILVT